MGLSCSCGDYDYEPGLWYWESAGKLTPMPFKVRRVRCCSCKGFIEQKDLAAEFPRHMCLDEDSIEYRIGNGDRRMASWWECEECTDLREALEELGYCVPLGDYMKDLIDEHNSRRKELENE